MESRIEAALLLQEKKSEQSDGCALAADLNLPFGTIPHTPALLHSDVLTTRLRKTV